MRIVDPTVSSATTPFACSTASRWDLLVACLPKNRRAPRRGRRPPNAGHRSEAVRRCPRLTLDQYSRLIGKKIVMDNTFNSNELYRVLGLEDAGPPQRINLIEKKLFLSGYSLVDADADTVTVLGPSKIPRSVGRPLYTRPKDLPAGERVFSYACKLEYCDAIEMAGPSRSSSWGATR